MNIFLFDPDTQVVPAKYIDTIGQIDYPRILVDRLSFLRELMDACLVAKTTGGPLEARFEEVADYCIQAQLITGLTLRNFRETVLEYIAAICLQELGGVQD